MAGLTHATKDISSLLKQMRERQQRLEKSLKLSTAIIPNNNIKLIDNHATNSKITHNFGAAASLKHKIDACSTTATSSSKCDDTSTSTFTSPSVSIKLPLCDTAVSVLLVDSTRDSNGSTGGTHRQPRRCQSQSSIRIRNRPHSACRYRDTKRKRKDYSLKSNQSAANLLSSARKLDLKNINDVGSLSTRNVVLHSARQPASNKNELLARYKAMESEISSRISMLRPHREAIAQQELLSRGKYLGNLPDDIYFEAFQYLDAITLAKISHTCDAWYHTIVQSIRYLFSIVFLEYPDKLPVKTIFWVMRRLHFLDGKRAGELLFWSCARGYLAYVQHSINAINFYKQRKRYEEMKQAHENSTNLTDDEDQGDDDSLDQESKILLSPPIAPQVKLPYIKGGVNAVSKHDSMTPLHLACRHHQTSVVDLLLQHQDVQVNKLTKQGKHSISIAAEKGYNDIVKLLVNHPNVNLNTTNSSGESLLYNATTIGAAKTVQVLLEKGADPVCTMHFACFFACTFFKLIRL